MSNRTRHHATRRGRAIDRLRTLTTGAAVAGLAGTAGFGILAAATWSGDPTATGAAGAGTTTDGTSGTSGTSGTQGSGSGSGDQGQGTDPNDIFGTVPNATPTAKPRVHNVLPATGPGHVSSGGSH